MLLLHHIYRRRASILHHSPLDQPLGCLKVADSKTDKSKELGPEYK